MYPLVLSSGKTDGVVEARTTDGELLGFDRVKAMTTQSADSIVQAAQEFGQDDDITVPALSSRGNCPNIE